MARMIAGNEDSRAALAGLKFTVTGVENLPRTGGAVIAINHTGYVDFLPAGLAAYHRGRRMRFMIKAEMQQVRLVNYLIHHTGTIPVPSVAGSSRSCARPSRYSGLSAAPCSMSAP